MRPTGLSAVSILVEANKLPPSIFWQDRAWKSPWWDPSKLHLAKIYVADFVGLCWSTKGKASVVIIWHYTTIRLDLKWLTFYHISQYVLSGLVQTTANMITKISKVLKDTLINNYNIVSGFLGTFSAARIIYSLNHRPTSDFLNK